MSEISDVDAQCLRVLTARTGWGRSQAAAFLADMTPDERRAVATCGTQAEHAAAAEALFNDLSDRVRKRRDEQRKAAAAARAPADVADAPKSARKK